MSVDVSAVIAHYNAPEMVVCAIDSVLASGEGSVEVVVVDDGSSREAADRVESLAVGRGCKVVRQANRGVAAARNAGLAHATGNWVAVLDQDDCWHPSRMAGLRQAMRDHPTALAIGTTSTKFCVASEEVSIREVGEWVDAVAADDFVPRDIPLRGSSAATAARTITLANFMHGNHFLSGATLVRREVLIAAGGFPIAAPMVDDYLAWLNVSRLTDWVAVDHPSFLYRVRASSVGHTRDMTMPELAGLVFNWFGRREMAEDRAGRSAAMRAYAPWLMRRAFDGAIAAGDWGRLRDAKNLFKALAPTWRDRLGVTTACLMCQARAFRQRWLRR